MMPQVPALTIGVMMGAGQAEPDDRRRRAKQEDDGGVQDVLDRRES